MQQKTSPRKNFEGIGKTNWKKNLIQKIQKKSKNQSEIAACEQKNHQRESELLLKLRFLTVPKKFHVAKALAFSLHFLFRRDKITTPILQFYFKNHENV